MPRKKLIETDQFPYHITNRSNNKEFFYLSNDMLWPIVASKISYLDRELKIKTHAFLLMSNHYHWVLSTPEKNLSDGMTYFHREIARDSNKKSGRINHFFGGRYKWCLIKEEIYYWSAIKYVFRNPVRAAMCEKVEEYPFSSLNDVSYKQLWNMVDFFNNPSKKIELDSEWLNEPYLKEEDQAIKLGLRRREFKIPSNKNRNKFIFTSRATKRDLVPIRR